MSKQLEDNLSRIAAKIKKECIKTHGNTEEAAKAFWKKLVTVVYEKYPDAVQQMIDSQPCEQNKQYMQSIYDNLKN